MNCPVTVDDIETAQNVCGKDTLHVKGRTMWHNPPKTLTPTMAMPKELKAKNAKITTCMDMMCINEISFVATMSHPMHCRGCECVEDNKKESFHKALDKMLQMHNKGGFEIQQIECD